MEMELTKCSEMLVYTIQRLGNHPKERIKGKNKCSVCYTVSWLLGLVGQ
jgi:hypothetical protein